MKRSGYGFTLIELLIVLVIIGIAVGMVVFVSSGVLAQRRVIQAAYRLQQSINAAQMQALLQNKVLGLRIRSQGYHWFSLNAHHKWVSVKRGAWAFAKVSGVRLQMRAPIQAASDGPDLTVLGDFSTSYFVIEVAALSSRKTRRYVVGNGTEAAVVAQIPPGEDL